MRPIFIALAAAASCLPAVCTAVEHLGEVKSEVFEARGTPEELRARARMCIDQLSRHDELRKGDEDHGVLVTNLAVEYGVNSILKSVMTFEARPDRFRITHTSVARGTAEDGAFELVAMKWGSGWKRVEKILQAKSAEIAACVKSADRVQQVKRTSRD